MANILDHLAAFNRQVSAVTAAGGTTTATHSAILERHAAAVQPTATAAARLAASILDGTDSGDLYALALAEEADAIRQANVQIKVAEAVYPALRREYSKVAEANWRALADRFNATAAALAEAVKTVDPDTAPESLMDAPTKTRQAWAEAPMRATELDAQIEAMVTAANLHDTRIGAGQESRIALTVRTESAHRRRLWEAWETTEGRAHRWAALIKAGVRIGAPETLDGFTQYRRPKELEMRYERSEWGHRPVLADPEDADYKPLSSEGKTVAFK